MYCLDIRKQTIKVNGKIYEPETFCNDEISLDESFPKDLFFFLKEWFSQSPFLEVKTSGSTGIPKNLKIEKTRMMMSAKLTCSFLGLKQNDKALLCLPLDYIAGKMMVVRALVAGLDIYPVSSLGNPLRHTDIPFAFAALVPMQVYNILQSTTERNRLEKIDKVIIGGGFIEDEIENELKTFSNAIYATYGMTETLSHIALRRLSGEEASSLYTPLESVKLSVNQDGALVIDAPLVSSHVLYTNDIVNLHKDGRFSVIGRKDNVINSGGVKIQVEDVEKKLRAVISGNFAIGSIPDAKFGEVVVLVVEEGVSFDKESIEKVLPKYSIPKKIMEIPELPLTETGKISRKVLKEIILSKKRDMFAW